MSWELKRPISYYLPKNNNSVIVRDADNVIVFSIAGYGGDLPKRSKKQLETLARVKAVLGEGEVVSSPKQKGN